ncbi:YolD-like family protein [Fictibacillus sp. B-59209]|uniref:YolD-like family protein n=1 Tax=Fictibacillus sp. B-59209 TaxID=3024873 RepID=UPI002E24E8A9|nr:YolD-like family protein [Fictibacillus sp. B-59209]
MKPELDEQQLVLMEDTIGEAMEHNLDLCFTYFERGDFHLLIGKVHAVVQHKKELRIVDFHGDVIRLQFLQFLLCSQILPCCSKTGY